MAEAQTAAGAKVGKAAKGAKENRKSGSDIDMSASPTLPEGYRPRLKQLYLDTVRGAMVEQFGYKNALAGAATR